LITFAFLQNGSNRTPECVASEGGHLDIAAYLHKSEVSVEIVQLIID